MTMDSRPSLIQIYLLILMFSCLCLQSKAEIIGSIEFIDGSSQKYIRKYQPDATSERKSLSVDEVGAAVSVLLGSPPAATISSDSSTKLNEVLLPSLFDRPQAVFVLEIGGLEDTFLAEDGAYSSKLVGKENAHINFLGNNAFVVNLDEPLTANIDAITVDHELRNLVQFSGELTGSVASVIGNLTVMLSDHTSLDLNLEKDADREFVFGLVALSKRIKKAIEMHDSGYKENPSELIMGRFNNLQLLKEQYGSGKNYEKSVKMLQESLSKLLDSLQMSFGGKFVAVVLSRKDTHSEPLLEVKFSPQLSRRLEDVSPPDAAIVIAETVLVRRILAWITGIILIVATLIGIYYLFNMPLTRDTLLYSNVKLD